MAQRKWYPIPGVKLRILWNTLKNFKKRWFLNIGLGLFLANIVFGGTFVFFHYVVFGTLYQFQYQEFGPLLANRLIYLSFVAFFYMLLFSNIVSVLATVYFSKETSFLMALPFSHEAIFWGKFVESLLYSSWALVAVSMPMLFSYGMRQGMSGDASPWWFYPLVPVCFMIFASIPALLGACLTLLFTSFLPARRARVLLMGLLCLFALAMWPMASRLVRTVRQISPGSGDAGMEEFQALLESLRMNPSSLAPHLWMGRAMQALVDPKQWGEFLFWFGLLLTTSLLLLQLMRHLVPKLYYRGWAMCGLGGRRRRNSEWSPWDMLEPSVLRPFHSSTRALVIKDIKIFWRDPGQWVQLVVLFGLLVIYVANLRSMPVGVDSPFWQNVLSFFNLAASCFVASTMTTRFAYPMLSLEGRQCWVIGLAPIRSTHLVWQKFWLSWSVCAIAVGTIIYISSETIQLRPGMKVLCYSTALLMTLGLSSLAVGIGALLPDFKQDNPASIANNMGGTLTVIVSMAYVGITTLSEAVAVDQYMVKGLLGAGWFLGFCVVLLLFNLAVIVIPMGLALRKWRRIDFV